MRPFAMTLGLLSLFTSSASAEAISNPNTYPLSTCVVSGKTLGEHGDPVTLKVGDREVRLCCKMCVKDFEGSQATYLQKIDQAIIGSQTTAYPLDTCVISGEKLGGAMGAPVDRLVGNRLVRLCCAGCVEKVSANPAAAIAKLDAAVVAAQLPTYTATTCPISGEALGGAMGKPVQRVFAGQLVQLCCSGCLAKFDANPTAALAKLAESTEAPGKPSADHSGHKH